MPPIGHSVHQRRTALGLSARQLARLAGVGDATVLRIEKGSISQPTPKTMRAINGALEQWSKLPVDALPPLTSYLRARYPHISERIVWAMADYFDYLTSRHGAPSDFNGADER